MGYRIELDVYQGPFDLLLDLIAHNKVDLWDIPIATITEQYLEYLYSLQEQDLAITGEFLVMAATLIRIKSRLLLPQEPPETEDEDEHQDPRIELVEQLVRYKFFKEVSTFLAGRYAEAARHFTRGQRMESLDLTPEYTDPIGDLTLSALGELYHQLLIELEREPPVHTISGAVSLPERLALVRLQLVGQPRATFSALLRDSSAAEIVVTFLAVLELVRLGEITMVQTRSFGEIDVRPAQIEVEVRQ
ncbi:MAG: segregation/condensation protein A [Limnochordia bacterium]|jgi:segregation and condensation protein A|nr:segregation/condensation protein A [Limnochordia bacterium]